MITSDVLEEGLLRKHCDVTFEVRMILGLKISL
jgi:hypothetical protein